MRSTYRATVELTFSLDENALTEQELNERDPGDLLRVEIASLGYSFPEVCDVHDESVRVTITEKETAR